MPEAHRIVIIDGKEYREGPCLVPGCTYLYRRPRNAYLKLCELHLRRYKARQSLIRVQKHMAKRRAARAAESKRKALDTLR